VIQVGGWVIKGHGRQSHIEDQRTGPFRAGRGRDWVGRELAHASAFDGFQSK